MVLGRDCIRIELLVLEFCKLIIERLEDFMTRHRNCMRTVSLIMIRDIMRLWLRIAGKMKSNSGKKELRFWETERTYQRAPADCQARRVGLKLHPVIGDDCPAGVTEPVA